MSIAAREGDPQLNASSNRSRHGSPQSDKKRYPNDRLDHLRNDRYKLRYRLKLGNCTVTQRRGGCQAQQQQAYTGPAVGECRK